MTLDIDPSAVPEEMKSRTQWVAWKSVPRDGQPKPAKIPVDPKTGRPASVSDPSTWGTYKQAIAYAQQHGCGIGFVLTNDDPFCCIDLDATDDPAVQGIQRELLNSADGAYIETSPSGKGSHIWVKHGASVTSPRAVPGVECYTSERFITITGKNARGELGEMPPALTQRLAPCFVPKPDPVVPLGPLDTSDLDVLRQAHARFGERFVALWRGQWDHESQSEADFEFTRMLVPFSGDDVQVGRLFLESELGQRDKARRRDYLPRTIQNARREVQEYEEWRTIMRPIVEGWAANMWARIRNRVAGLLVRWEDFLPLASLLLLVKGILGAGGVSVVYGLPGTGKSFLVLDIAVAVATGSSWMGNPTEKGPVIYAAGEGVSGLRHRRTAILRARGFEKPSVAFLTVALNTPQEVETFLLVLDQATEWYLAPPSLLIIDTLARFFGEGDENTAKDMAQFLAALDRLRRKYPNMHIMIVHHAGKDETKGMRGSSALKGAADTVILCTKSNTKIGETRYLATVEKQKDGEEGLKLPFQLKKVEVGRDETGEPITSCVVEPAYDARTAGPTLTEPQVVAATILRELARTDGLMNSAVDYKAYRDRFCELRGSNDQAVRKAASRAMTDLRDKYGAVEWAKGEESIHILERIWNLTVPVVQQ